MERDGSPIKRWARSKAGWTPAHPWNDRIVPRSPSYGTAMALLVLVAPDLPPIPEWTLPSKDIAKESPPHGD